VKRVLKYLCFIVLAVAILLLYNFSIHRNQSKIIEDVEVEFEAGENSFLTHKSVNKLLIQNKETVKKQPKSILDLHRLENTVEESPYVENATVFVTPEGILKTQISQREPVARIISNTEVYYLDRYGVKLPLAETFSARVPLVFGLDSSDNFSEITELVTLILMILFLEKKSQL